MDTQTKATKRGPEDVMNHLAREAQHGKVKSILFLTPCHATPYYSMLHHNLPMKFLDCTPSEEKGIPDESDRFLMDPVPFVSEYAKKWSTPSHIVLFDSEEQKLRNFLISFGYREDGVKPIQVAAAKGNRAAVEILFPLTSKVDTVPTWTTDGILEYMQSETNKDETINAGETSRPKDTLSKEKNVPEVAPEVKKRAAEAKSRGDDVFKSKDFHTAIDSYTQAIDLDPTDATLLSNRSLCWIRLGQAEQALADAKACRALRPDWPKACYREGAALRVLQACYPETLCTLTLAA